VPNHTACATCKIGPFAIYAPTFAQSPKHICELRTEVVRIKARRTIQRADEPPTRAYTLFSGWACRSVHFHDGRRQILSFLLPGDAICLENIWVENFIPRFSVRSLTDVTLCAFAPHDLYDLVNSNRPQKFCFSRHIEILVTQAERRLVDIGRRRAIARIARLVLDLHATLHERGLADADAFDFPLRQEDLADALGITPAHVNRTLNTLRRRGLLNIAQGRAKLMDIAALKALGANE
jgi:CRP/FNR family transcriptional regulator, anaerobic regulatory protein